MVSVFATAILGALIGAAGKGMMPSRDKGGLITTMTLGLCGASLTGSMGWLMGWWEVGAGIGFAAAAGAAVFALIVYRIFAGVSWE